MGIWPQYSTDFIRRRFNRLAPIYRVFDLVFWLPPGICTKAVWRLELKPGYCVLEVGCGTGRNFGAILEAIGPHGHLYGVDISDGMLARAKARYVRRGWRNVTLLQCEASSYSLSEPVDGVLFSLSYEVIPDHCAALRHAWSHLRPGGRVVIVGGKTPSGILGKLLGPIGALASRATVLGSPYKRPWEDLRELTDNVRLEEFAAGSYYVCVGRKT